MLCLQALAVTQQIMVKVVKEKHDDVELHPDPDSQKRAELVLVDHGNNVFSLSGK